MDRAAPGKEQGLVSLHVIRALWTDCDPAGIMFYGTYFRWMDEASYYLFRKAGLRWESWKGELGIIGTPLVTAHCDFRTPVAFGDEVTVRSHIAEWGRTSFTVSHRFAVGERLTAEGYEKRVWCTGDPSDPATIAPAPIPDEVRARFAG
jgi:YbgC/YbaW family acyl-CoA thioester hydrolase